MVASAPDDRPEADRLGSDALTAVYNQELITLSARAAVPVRLSAPTHTAHAVSPICGSEVTVDLIVENDRITDFGFDVQACALAKTVIAVLRDAVIGKTRADIARAASEMEAMLDGKPVIPSGDFARLILLAPVKDYTARHNSVLLPFEAIDKAFTRKS